MLFMHRMREIMLIVLFAVLTSFSDIGPVNGLWISLFLKFNESRLQQRILDQPNLQDGINETAPSPFSFPDFYNYLRPIIKNPLKHMAKEIKEKNDVRNGNVSFGKHVKKNEDIKNIKTGGIAEEIEPTASSHSVKKKIMERFSHSEFLKKIFHPLNRINLFQHFHINFSENEKIPKRERREIEKQTIPLNVNFEILNVNETEEVTQNSTARNQSVTCDIHFTSDCLLIWRVDWNSVTLSVVFILILLFVLYILFVCCLYVGGLFLLSYFVLLGLFLFRLRRRRKKDVFTQTNTVAKPLTA